MFFSSKQKIDKTNTVPHYSKGMNDSKLNSYCQTLIQIYLKKES